MTMLDLTTLVNILLIAISGTLICLAVHFIPVGGAPAAMAQASENLLNQIIGNLKIYESKQ